jgi:small-conductance mechanosensitive channel
MLKKLKEDFPMNYKRGVAYILLPPLAAAAFGFWVRFPALNRSLVQWFAGPFRQVFDRPFFHLGSLPVTLSLVIEVILYVVILGFFAHLIRTVLQNRLLTRTSLSPGQRYAFSRITGYVIFVLGLTIGLQSTGLNLNSLLVVGGAVGIGVGLGVQNLANNFVSGLVLLFEQPIRLGDRVEVGGVLGDVVRMASRSIWVRTNDNVVIIVPNSEFTASRVTNWTANDRRVRFAIPLGVSYDSDPEEVREVVLEVARRHPDVLHDPPPEFLFLGFGDSSINFELRVWTVAQVQTPKVLSSDLYFAIFREFGEKGIEIPYPQRDLHVKSFSSPISVTSA